MDERFYWIALGFVKGIGAITCKELIKHFKNPEHIFKASKEELLKVGNMNEDLISLIKGFNEWRRVEQEIKKMERYGVRLLTLNDPDYPENLLNIYDPPPLLYMKGEIKKEDRLAIAVVGSRACSNYGRIIAERISRELALNGITVVSGFARGIDSTAHRGALSVKGRTIGVLGSGMDNIYPRENKRLFLDITENGAIITEFPMGTKPYGFNFPRRNRIISGLSMGVLVVEADEKSGSLITANYALEQGREVFAVPGSPLLKNSKGTNRLLKEGAKLVESVEDILEEIFPNIRKKEEDIPSYNPASENEKLIISLLNYEPVHIDELVKKSGIGVSELLSILLKLEIEGIVRQLPGKFFVKNG